MAVPNLTKEDIKSILANEDIEIGTIIKGGQKIVVPVVNKNDKYLAKFIEINNSSIFTQNGDDAEKIEDSTLGRLRREIEILSKSDCENIVAIYSDNLMYKNYKGQHIYYYLEEYIEGCDIQKLLDQNYKFTINEIFNFAFCINRAIACLWSNKIIHRDIKPQNIIYNSEKNKFILIDPGVAFDLGGVSYTQTGGLVGTKFFMSPEQYITSKRRNLDFRSDHFLLGICLYIIATNKHPFFMNAKNEQDVLYNILYNKHIPVVELNPSIPIDLSNIIDKLLSKETFKRYRTPNLLEQDLIKAQGGLHGSLYST